MVIVITRAPARLRRTSLIARSRIMHRIAMNLTQQLILSAVLAVLVGALPLWWLGPWLLVR